MKENGLYPAFFLNKNLPLDKEKKMETGKLFRQKILKMTLSKVREDSSWNQFPKTPCHSKKGGSSMLDKLIALMALIDLFVLLLRGDDRRKRK